MNQEISEQDLVNGCIKKNRKYQELLYRKYAGKMYAVCLNYARDREIAQDILQEGYIKVFKKIKDFKQNGSLEGWIRRIIINTAIDYYRKASRYNELLDKELKREESEFSENSIIENINADEILNYLKKLPEGARMVFNLYAVEGYSHKEIAEKLNISEGTSKSQFSRARSLLQQWLMINKQEF